MVTTNSQTSAILDFLNKKNDWMFGLSCNRNDRNFRKNSRRAKAGKENYLRICSDHFPSDALHKTLGGKWVLKADSNPIHSHDLIENKERKTAGEKRGFRPDEDEVEEAITFKSPRPSSDECFSSSTGFTSTDDPLLDHTYCLKTTSYTDTSTKIPGKTSTATQTDLNHEEIRIMEEEIIKLKKENDELSKKINNKSALKRELFIEDVLKSDESVKFYTGVPSKDSLLLLLSIHESEAKKLKYWDKSTSKSKTMFYEKTDKKKPGPRRTLSLLLEFVMTLVRLRLGLTQKHLSDIFAISESQVCRITLTWICFLSSSLRETLLLWPSKENIRRKLPRSFKDYPNTRVIIDCTEMFVEKPSSPYAQKATWSEYKQHNTIKTLVGITPNGYFSFLSKFWTGNTSDRKITQESGLVDLLEKGDVVMADKGFNIRDILTKKEVYLNIPPFSKKGKQLSRAAARSTRKIAQVRIHVERAIERLKEFKVFQGNIPLTLVPMTNHMLVVCGALCNLQKPLVK